MKTAIRPNILRITEAIANLFNSIAYIDIKNNIFDEVKFHDRVRELVGSHGKASDALMTTATVLSDKAYVDRMVKFNCLDTLSERLADTDSISMEFYGNNLGWSRARFIVVDRDENGEALSVAYLVEQIDGEILSLRSRLNIEETLTECIRTMNYTNNFDKAIDQLLSIVADYYGADRGYIFEIDYGKNVTNNLYEWCKSGIKPEIELLQNIDISSIERWLELFSKGDCINIGNATGELDHNSYEYELLELQGISSLISAPFNKNGSIIGFLGVDNPTRNTESNILIKSVAEFITVELEKKHNIEMMYRLSYKDSMTGLFNRHAYITDINAFNEIGKENMGIIFADVNGLKITNDKYGHEQGDQLLINAADSLTDFFSRSEDKIYRIGGDEFVVFCHDINCDDFNARVEEYRKKLGPKPIASVGEVWIEKCCDLEKQIKAADDMMYSRKREYYESCGINRRKS